MNAQQKRTSVTLALAAAALGAGVFAALPMAKAQTTAPAGMGSSPAAASMPEPDFSKPVAVINDREINNKAFYQMLMQVSGLRVYEEVRDWVLIQQACAGAGIPTSGESFQKAVQAEIDRTLEGISQQTKQTGNQITDREQLIRIMNGTLAQRGVVQSEFSLGVQRAAGLRLLAKGHVDVTDAELKQAFEARYGEKVEVDVISVPDAITAAKVRDLITKQGKKPLEVNQAMGVPVQSLTISKNADQIKEIRDVAFKLNVGELSASVPAPNGQGSVLIYMQKKDAADPTAKMTDPATQKEVHDFVYNIKETEWMNNHLTYLRNTAHVNINDPTLFAEISAQQAQSAATQASSAPAPVGLPAPGAATAPGR